MKIRSSAEIAIDGAREHEDANRRIGKCCGNRVSHLLDHLSTEGVDWCAAEFEPSDATINAQTREFEPMSHWDSLSRGLNMLSHTDAPYDTTHDLAMRRFWS
jgi:hypothetical protein